MAATLDPANAVPAPADALAAPAAAPEKIAVVLVCKGRPDATLSAAIGMMNLQTRLVQTDIQTEVHVVDWLDDAINLARQARAHLFAVETSIGFNQEFVVRALASAKDVIVAAYPLPTIDWDRVVASAATESSEPMKFRGNVYSAMPATESAAADGYVRADSAMLGCVFIRAGVADDIAARHPELQDAEGNGMFAFERVVDGTRSAPHETFAALYGQPVWIDLNCPATQSGPLPFAGCVGLRTVLR